MTPVAAVDEHRASRPGSDASVRFPSWLLNVGFGFALAVAAACLALSAWYLFTFLRATNSGIEDLLRSALQNPSTSASVIQLSILARTAMARFALLSCGICVGMGFGFLGFALFLIGVKGEMDVEAQHEKAQVKIARMAPGVFVILCATVLIGVCVTFRTQYEWAGADPAKPAAAAETPAAPPDTLPRTAPGEQKP